MKILKILVCICGTFLFWGAGASANLLLSGLQPVQSVEISKYSGLWHEQMRVPNAFQDNSTAAGLGPCFNSTAQYVVLPDGRLQVINSCTRYGDADIAKAESVTGTAEVVAGSNNAKLRVSFGGAPVPEIGNYWILALGPLNFQQQYSWVLVGTPDYQSGWILSRQNLGEADLAMILQLAEEQGYMSSDFISMRK